jgi:hypothetical protein
VVSGSADLSTTATTSSDVGTYPIAAAAGTLSAANYSFGFAPGTLTITQATPAVAVTSPLLNNVTATLTYGSANTPVVGQTVVFTINKTGAALCSAVTDSTGLASCKPSGSQHLTVITNGYVATFAGSTDFAAVTKISK